MVAGVIFIFILVNFFEQLDRFVDRRAAPFSIVRYYWFQLPALYVLFSPVGGLLAAFLSVGEMARHHEILAMKAVGVSVYRILRPLVLTGLLLTGVSFLVNDLVVPSSNRKVREIKEIEIDHRKTPEQRIVARDFSFFSPKGVLYYFERIDANRNTARGVIVMQFKNGELQTRIDAREGRFVNGHWVFSFGTERIFHENEEQVERFEERAYPDLRDSPFKILKEKRELKELNVRELWTLIQNLKTAGLDRKRETVELHIRFSFPFANLIVLLFALALSVQMRGRGRAYAFGLAVFLAFFYWGVLQATRSMAGVGKLNPLFSAWFPNLIFLALAGFAFRKVHT